MNRISFIAPKVYPFNTSFRAISNPQANSLLRGPHELFFEITRTHISIPPRLSFLSWPKLYSSYGSAPEVASKVSILSRHKFLIYTAGGIVLTLSGAAIFYKIYEESEPLEEPLPPAPSSLLYSEITLLVENYNKTRQEEKEPFLKQIFQEIEKLRSLGDLKQWKAPSSNPIEACLGFISLLDCHESLIRIEALKHLKVLISQRKNFKLRAPHELYLLENEFRQRLMKCTDTNEFALLQQRMLETYKLLLEQIFTTLASTGANIPNGKIDELLQHLAGLEKKLAKSPEFQYKAAYVKVLVSSLSHNYQPITEGFKASLDLIEILMECLKKGNDLKSCIPNSRKELKKLLREIVVNPNIFKDKDYSKKVRQLIDKDFPQLGMKLKLTLEKLQRCFNEKSIPTAYERMLLLKNQWEEPLSDKENFNQLIEIARSLPDTDADLPILYEIVQRLSDIALSNGSLNVREKAIKKLDVLFSLTSCGRSQIQYKIVETLIFLKEDANFDHLAKEILDKQIKNYPDHNFSAMLRWHTEVMEEEKIESIRLQTKRDNCLESSIVLTPLSVPELSPHFIRRLFKTSKLTEALSQSMRQRKAQIYVITGSMGVGKSQLVLDYMYQHKWDYTKIAFIQASKLDALYIELDKLAEALALPKQEKAEERYNLMKNWLEINPGWLLIFDNLELEAEEMEKLKKYLPKKGGNILITSCTANQWKNQLGAQEIGLDNFSSGEAVHFLLNATNLTDRIKAEEIANELQNHPQVLASAAYYITTHGLNFSSYLDRIKESRTEFLSKHQDPLSRTNGSILAARNLTFEAVKKKQPLAIELLHFCANLDPSHIPKSLLNSWFIQHCPNTSSLSKESQLSKVDELIAVLLNHHIITINNLSKEESIAIQRLDQDAIKNTLSLVQRKNGLRKALLVLNSCLPRHDIEGSQAMDKRKILMPHIEAVLHEIKKTDRKIIDQAFNNRDKIDYFKIGCKIGCYVLILDFINAKFENSLKAGCCFLRNGNLTKLKDKIEEALKIDKQFYLKRYPELLKIYNDQEVGWKDGVLYPQIKMNGKKPGFYLEDPYLTEYSSLGDVHYNLAIVLEQRGQHSQAIENYLSALRIWERIYDPDHPKLADAHNNLGNAFTEAGQNIEARKHYKQTLQIWEKIYPPDHPRLAYIHNSLGNVYLKTQKYQQAINEYKEAFEIVIKNFPYDHPTFISTYNNLGNALIKMGECQQTTELLKKEYDE
ncbi:hypothetical protein NEOC84_000807|uniref:tetratricopeptide repeat protein n=1 Tax=Neochlamydia sp. AcF84 TaxID=2315858 RepID=UPI00140A5391|nr:tetratricopeptide repeat protein [Neochlamydia sp. AcF84]NGY94906.1 hypothetical protein [Neochlamydia sp. AcF84]